MTTTVIVIIVVVLVVAAIAAFLVSKRNSKRDEDARIAQAEEIRSQAAAQAQTTIAPAQQEAAEAEAKAEEARREAEEVRRRAEQAEAEAREAQVAAQQVEAEHEAQVRDADRLDPRVDHTADDYAPQVPGDVDQQPTPPSEADRESQAGTDAEGAPDTGATDGETTTREQAAPGLPQRTRGAQEMPGQPIPKIDEGGGWFTRKDSDGDKA